MYPDSVAFTKLSSRCTCRSFFTKLYEPLQRLSLHPNNPSLHRLLPWSSVSVRSYIYKIVEWRQHSQISSSKFSPSSTSFKRWPEQYTYKKSLSSSIIQYQRECSIPSYQQSQTRSTEADKSENIRPRASQGEPFSGALSPIFSIRKLPTELHHRLWRFVIIDNATVSVYSHKRNDNSLYSSYLARRSLARNSPSVRWSFF